MIEQCSSFVLLTIHRYYIKPDKVNFLVSVTFEVFMYLALYTELINHIDQLRSANSFMKPEERPYLFHAIRPLLLAFASSDLFFWPLHHLSFSFDLCIICPFLLAFVSSVLFFWPLYHLYFSFGLCIIRPFLLAFAVYALLLLTVAPYGSLPQCQVLLRHCMLAVPIFKTSATSH